MRKNIIVSPSGNFYGSEQVLFDYLNNTQLSHIVYVPKDSTFKNILTKANLKSVQKIKSFKHSKLIQLYLLFFLKIITKQIATIYINEGAHIRYITLLAKFFPKIKFIVHLRMIYDSSIERISSKLSGNIQIIAISNYVAQPLENRKINYAVLYDGFDFHATNQKISQLTGIFQIGIIGRVSRTKGFNFLIPIIEKLEFEGTLQQFNFRFFGEVKLNREDQHELNTLLQKFPFNISLKGFKNSESIYQEIDAVLHLCKEEGLGRVFFESIENEKPFVGFNTAGIAEIGKIAGLSKLLVQPDNQNWVKAMTENLINLTQEYAVNVLEIRQAKVKLASISNIQYATRLDTYFHE